MKLSLQFNLWGYNNEAFVTVPPVGHNDEAVYYLTMRTASIEISVNCLGKLLNHEDSQQAVNRREPRSPFGPPAEG